MPRGDGTGPDGMGPMTGRAAGYCNGFDRPGYANGGRGFFGRGFGGRGFRRGFRGYSPRYGGNYNVPQYSEEQEKGFLEQELNYLKTQMESIQKRLSELGKK